MKGDLKPKLGIIKKAYQHIQPLLIAIQFLSSLPVGHLPMPKDKDVGASLMFYPIVGALLGVILSVLALGLMQVFGSSLSAALLLTAWVVLTGALHIDGLADCADAWMGGLGSKSRTLELMKDPTSGPIAIATVILVLLVKYAALEALLTQAMVQQSYYLVLIWPLMLSRMSAMILFATTPYARKNGLGKAISEHLSSNAVWGVCCVVLVVACLVFRWHLVTILVAGFAVFIYLRHLMLSRIDGCTGDTAGALIELSEVAILLACVAYFSMSLS
ncbi:MAG: adenosylcobinamide-GDP ribazoletransferase [Oleiphilaceae bacterium]